MNEMKFSFGIDPRSSALFMGTKDYGIEWTNDGIYSWTAGKREKVEFDTFTTELADLLPVVRCENCKFYMAETEERCNTLKSSPFGWCLRQRQLREADHREMRYHMRRCEYAESMCRLCISHEGV